MTHPEDRNAVALRATEPDVADVVSILVGAFYDDPVWSWAFPDPALRAEQQGWLWELSVRGAMRYPWVWTTAGRTAATVWIPPNGTELTEEQEATVEPALREMLGASADTVLSALDMFEHAHPSDEPHFYLSLLGTHTEHRGFGYGLGLLSHNLRAIDETHMPAYLESSNLANVPLYERYGFVVRSSFTLPADGPEVFTMWRDATPR